jgi:hypothetical protein
MKAHRRQPFCPLPLGDGRHAFEIKKKVQLQLLVRDVLDRRLLRSKVAYCLVTFHSLHRPQVCSVEGPWPQCLLPQPPSWSLFLTLPKCFHLEVMTLCQPLYYISCFCFLFQFFRLPIRCVHHYSM